MHFLKLHQNSVKRRSLVSKVWYRYFCRNEHFAMLQDDVWINTIEIHQFSASFDVQCARVEQRWKIDFFFIHMIFNHPYKLEGSIFFYCIFSLWWICYCSPKKFHYATLFKFITSSLKLCDFSWHCLWNSTVLNMNDIICFIVLIKKNMTWFTRNLLIYFATVVRVKKKENPKTCDDCYNVTWFIDMISNRVNNNRSKTSFKVGMMLMG